MIKRLVLLVIHEAAVWVARRTTDPLLTPVVGKVMDRLDYEMPYILRTSNYGSINNLIFGLVAKETGLKDEGTITHLVNQVCEIYDPRLGASKS